jgi:hypothetical protein
MKIPHGKPFARTVDLELAVAGAATTVLVQNDDSKGYLFILFSEIENVDADSVQIAWRDAVGTLYNHKKLTAAGTWTAPGQRDFCDIEGGMELVAVIADATGAATATVKVQGVRAR